LDALAKSGLITIVGEVEGENDCCVDIEQIVRDCCKDVGYDSVNKGLDYRSVNIITEIDWKKKGK
jgi:S-adenosylmethionine synthetase